MVFPANFRLKDLNGTNGIIINGINYDQNMDLLEGAGDINADGYSDIIIGDPEANEDIGGGYIVFGTNKFPSVFNLTQLNGNNGFLLKGVSSDFLLGLTISTAGDVNADGIDDIIIAGDNKVAFDDDDSIAGSAYVLYGSKDGFSQSVNLDNLNGTQGFIIVNHDHLNSVSNAGDINADGIDDIVTGSINSQIFVVFGQKGGLISPFLTSSLNGVNGFKIKGILGSENVNLAGDVNNDGIDDIIIGEPQQGVKEGNGAAYIIYGNKYFPAELDVMNLNGSNGFAMYSTNGSIPGMFVSGLGDINNDQVDDFGVTNFFPGGASGAGVYVVYGRKEGFPAYVNLDNLGSYGFIISKAFNANRIGDINKDGVADFALSACVSSNQVGPWGYVIFGSSNFSFPFDFSQLNGSNGFAFQNIKQPNVFYQTCSFSSKGGDINGDGIDDLVISGGVDPYTSGPQSYVIYGQSSNILNEELEDYIG
jgi:hypothetical protein